MQSLHHFLNSSHEILQKWLKSSSTILDVVIGNQAADADSIIGSLVYSYMLYSKHSDSNHYYLPLVHIKKEKIPLRSEVMELFSMVGIDYKSILTVYDFQQVIPSYTNHIHLHLVDHNVLSPSLQSYENNVVEIIDHRKDEGLYPNASRMISYNPIEGRGVGSCCTLLGKRLEEWHLETSMEECALLLEGVILLDTMNLSPSINKTTDEDITIVHSLEQKHPSIPIQQDILFERLKNAKYDPVFWSSLSLQDALDYDYKVFSMGSYQFGWSAVLTSLNQLLSKTQSLTKNHTLLNDFCKEKKIDGLILSAVINGDMIRREFYFFLSEKYEKDHSMNYYLKKMNSVLIDKYSCQKDMNNPSILFTYTPISRKALAPVLMELFELLVC